MQPMDFWECTLLDIGNFIVGNYNKEKYDKEKQNIFIYQLSSVIGDFNRVNIASMFKNGLKYKSFEETFPQSELIKSKKENDENKYDVINDDNKYEFLHKQKKAYEKMGIKFDN